MEALAAILEVDQGKTRLELEFADGRLTHWHVHNVRRPAGELAKWDAQSEWLAARL